MKTGKPSTRLYVLPALMIKPLPRLVLAQSPRRSAVVSATVSPLCARARAGAPHNASAQAARSNLLEVVMTRLYPRGVDSEPLHATIEIRPVSLEPSRCIGDVPARFSERASDDRALEAVKL